MCNLYVHVLLIITEYRSGLSTACESGLHVYETGITVLEEKTWSGNKHTNKWRKMVTVISEITLQWFVSTG